MSTKAILKSIQVFVSSSLILCCLAFFASPLTSALKPADGGSSSPPNKTTTTSPAADPAIQGCSNNQCDLVYRYLQPIINTMAALFGTIAVISLIAGGIQFSTSEGDPQKAGMAKRRITNTIIALLCFLFLYSFLQFLIPGGIFNRTIGG